MTNHISQCILFCYIAFLHFILITFAQSENYIIHMNLSAMPKSFTTHHTWYQSTLSSVLENSQFTTSNDLNSQTSSKLIYTYTHVMNGFSANLSPKEHESLQIMPGYISSILDLPLKLDTTYSPQFLGLNPYKGAWPASEFGKDVIVGIIDTGVWPESESFNDNGLSEIPLKWKGQLCQFENSNNSSLCNKKLIGAAFFNKGFLGKYSNISSTIVNSTRDTDGHGTHTSSTAAGRTVEGASFFGLANGTARGIASLSRVAIYKVAWGEDGGAVSSDVIAAIDTAISNGVDVLSISLGYDNVPLYEDGVAIATFAAMEKGVFVSTSAGNNGPSFKSLHNGTPWVITVAAGTMDREFHGNLTVFGAKPSPKVDSYSSKGPSNSCPYVLKPDITAPGTSILAAWPANIPVLNFETKIFNNFNFLTGTSMSCPHVAGVAALLKGAHPDWSPAAIRSAMMTTSDIHDNTKEPIKDAYNNKDATPLALGAGHINPNRALDPGLVYDVGVQDYVNLLCALNYSQKNITIITRSSLNDCSNPSMDLNYPSFIAFFNKGNSSSKTVHEFHRTVTNIGEGQTIYVANITPIKGFSISVIPNKLVFHEKNEGLSFKLRIEVEQMIKLKKVAFGYLSWMDVHHVVRSPIVVTTLDLKS